jgi:UPF0716 protein FxsA
MKMAKYLLLALLMLPAMELAAFIAVAVAIGALPALALVAATSCAGALILRHAGGYHIARVRTAFGQGHFTAWRADGTGGAVLVAGILLLIPGFITDCLGLLLLLKPLQRLFGTTPGRGGRGPEDGVVDLAPEQWHRVPDAQLTDRNEDGRRK